MATDFDLLEAWRAGDRSAGSELFERHFGAVGRFFANKVDRDLDELVQQTFLVLVEGKDNFRGDSKFRTYLFGVANNVLRSNLRKQLRDDARLDPAVTSIQALGITPTSMIARSERENLLLQALRRIPIDHQVVLELYYWEEMSASELGQALELPEGTIRGRIRRAKQLLLQQLENLAAADVWLEASETDIDRWATGLLARS